MPADGYTGLRRQPAAHRAAAARGRVQYKTEDITPVYFFHYTADAILVADDSPYKTFGDLVNAGKAKPGDNEIRRIGNLLRQPPRAREIQLLHRREEHLRAVQGHRRAGAGRARQARHRRDELPAVRAPQKGKMRMLAVATEERVPAFPDVPTFKELGFKWVDGAYRRHRGPEAHAARDPEGALGHHVRAQPGSGGMRTQLTDGGLRRDRQQLAIPTPSKELATRAVDRRG